MQDARPAAVEIVQAESDLPQRANHRGDGERPRRILEDVIQRGVAELGEQAQLAGLVDGAEEGDDVRVAELLRRVV